MYENGKLRHVEIIQRMGGRRIKKNDGVNLKYIVSNFANVTMYPQYTNNIIIK
jgi:hypothetical protein